MPLAQTAELIAAAHRAGRGVLAFNVITLEHAEAIVAGAEQAGSSVILQISENAVKFHHGRLGPIAAAAVAVAVEASIPASVHLDHVEDLTCCTRPPELVQVLRCSTPPRLEYSDNVAATAAAAQWAHEHGLFLEAELGEVGGKDGAHAPGVRTDPSEAKAFVDATGVDALAVAVGSSHAMSERTATLDFDLIALLKAAVPVPLVLHGSSGVSDEDLRKAVGAGITKVNVGTLLNVEFTAAVRDHLAANDAVTDPRKYLVPARVAIADAVASMISAID